MKPGRPGKLAASAAIAAGALAFAAPAFAQDAAEPSIRLAPEAITLTGGPGVIEVAVEGAPEIRGYDFELTFDHTLVMVTAVADGDFLSQSGLDVAFEPRLGSPGRLTVHAELKDYQDAVEGAGSESSGEEAGTAGSVGSGVASGYPGSAADPEPSGSGVLARVTLVPLSTGGPAPLGLANASLVALEGELVAVPRTSGGAITIAAVLPEAAQTEAVAQATALAESMAAESGSGGWSPGDLPSWSDLSAEVIWLALFALAVGFVLVGWF
ncbi:MAG: hypothetical protein ACK2T6_08830, partial [Anaerolineae bacterium]